MKSREKHEREYDCHRKNNFISADFLNYGNGRFEKYCYNQKDPSGGDIIPKPRNC